MPTDPERAEKVVREKSAAEKSKDVIQGVEQRFQLGSQDSGKAEIDRAAREPSVQDAEDYVRGNITATTEATNALKEIIGKGKYDTLTVAEKVAYHEALNQGNQATGTVREPDIVGLQGRWEQASEDLQHKAESRMRARDALSGQTKTFDEKSLTSDEALKLRAYVTQTETIEPADKTQIVEALQKSVDELVRAEGDMEALAKTKRWTPEEKDSRIAQFKASSERAKKVREEFYALRDRLTDYAPS